MDRFGRENGNDLEAVIGILEKAKTETGKGKPVAIILHTEMGYGVDYMMGTHAWHGKALTMSSWIQHSNNYTWKRRQTTNILQYRLIKIKMKYTYTKKGHSFRIRSRIS